MVAGVGAVREGLNRGGAAGGEPKSSHRFFGDAGELAPSPLLARGEKHVALPCLA